MGLNPLLQVMTPEASLFRDLNRQHQHVAIGACWQAIRNITGRDVSIPMLKKHFGRIVYEHGRFMEFTWKGRVIVRIHAPEIVTDMTGRLVQFRKIEQVWKKKAGSV